MDPTKFELGGRTFILAPLKVKKQLRVLALLTPVLQTFASKGQADLSSLDGLQELTDIFAGRCQVDWNGSMVALEPFIDNVFERRPTLTLSWLAECVRIELGDFLEESGRALIKETVARFGSLVASTGGSGASS